MKKTPSRRNCETGIPCRAGKNITIRIDDDLYRKARMKAAEQSTSISALFRNFLVRLRVGESAENEFP